MKRVGNRNVCNQKRSKKRLLLFSCRASEPMRFLCDMGGRGAGTPNPLADGLAMLGEP